MMNARKQYLFPMLRNIVPGTQPSVFWVPPLPIMDFPYVRPIMVMMFGFPSMLQQLTLSSKILCKEANDLHASLYSGDCGSLNEETCGRREAGQNFLQLYKGGLVPGTRLYLRVDSENGTNLKFGLCINNFFSPALDGSDCKTANLICSKESFTVRNVQGFGEVNELGNAPCFSHANESNSIWFRWICRDPGTFTFELIPLKEADDIDFVVYKVRGGCIRV